MPTSAKRRVFHLYLEFTDAHRKTGLSTLRKFSNRLFPQVPCYELIISNDVTADLEIQLSTHSAVISGDNSTREFSGWDKGLKWANDYWSLRDDDVIVLANDTFHRSYGDEYLAFFKNLDAELAAGAAVGYIDGYPEPISLFGLDLQYWIRSSLVVVNYGTLKKTLPLAIKYEATSIFSPNRHEFFQQDAPLSENYKRFIRTWLFGENFDESAFRESWHSQKTLTDENFEDMKAKARCILCEHSLSGRLQRDKIPIFNVREQKRL